MRIIGKPAICYVQRLEKGQNQIALCNKVMKRPKWISSIQNLKIIDIRMHVNTQIKKAE